MQTFNQIEQNEIIAVKDKIKNRLTQAMFQMPTVLLPLFRKCIVTGGISASYFHNEKENDIDVYLNDQESIDTLKQLISDKNVEVMDSIKDLDSKYDTLSVYVDGKVVTAQAVTFKSGIQIITMQTANSRDLFDFEHCKPYFDLEKQKYFISRKQYESIKSKQLVENPTAPKVDVWRKMKFINKGWKV